VTWSKSGSLSRDNTGGLELRALDGGGLVPRVLGGGGLGVRLTGGGPGVRLSGGGGGVRGSSFWVLVATGASAWGAPRPMTV